MTNFRADSEGLLYSHLHLDGLLWRISDNLKVLELEIINVRHLRSERRGMGGGTA